MTDHHNLYVKNNSSIRLVTVAMQADEVSGFEKDMWIGQGETKLVGTYAATDSSTGGWIDLGTTSDKHEFQIYFRKEDSRFHTAFGWYNPGRSKDYYNGRPFPPHVAWVTKSSVDHTYHFDGVQVDHHLKLFETVWKHTFDGGNTWSPVEPGATGEPQCDFTVEGKQILVHQHIHNGCPGAIKVTMAPYLVDHVIQPGQSAIASIHASMRVGDPARSYEIGGFYLESGEQLAAAIGGRSGGPARALPDPKFTITRSG
jgi:hypothetical protein